MKALVLRLLSVSIAALALAEPSALARARQCGGFFSNAGFGERGVLSAFAGLSPGATTQLTRRAVQLVADMPQDQGARVRAWVALASTIASWNLSWEFRPLPVLNAPGWIAFTGDGPAILFAPDGDVFRATIEPREYLRDGAWPFNPRVLRRVLSSEERAVQEEIEEAR